MFSDFKSNTNLFFTPFSVPVDNVPGNMQMTVIDTQCNGGLKEKYIYVALFGSYSKYIDMNIFPAIHSHALKMVSVFGSAYFCEQRFSRMKSVKSKTRTKITNTHLENTLQIATSRIKSDTDRLVENTAKFLTKYGHFYACKISKTCRLIDSIFRF